MACTCDGSPATTARPAPPVGADESTIRRHHVSHHLWGILSGLEVVLAADGRPLVEPGLATDGYGRLLIQSARYAIDPLAFDLAGSDILEVWLHHHREEVPPGPSADPCPSEDAMGVAESAVVVLLGDGEGGTPRAPKGVPDPNVSPAAPPPADPVEPWPVFLGRVQRIDGGTPPFAVLPSARPYAGVRAAEVDSPAPDGPRLLLGPDAAYPDTDFAIFADPAAPPQLEVANGDLCVRTTARLEQDLTVGGALELLGGQEPAVAPGGSWRLVHVKPAGGSGAAVEQLRVQIPVAAAGPPNEVAIGTYDAQAKAFHAILTVADTGRVTVDGDLVVKGNLSPTLAAAALQAALSGDTAHAQMLAANLKASDPATAAQLRAWLL